MGIGAQRYFLACLHGSPESMQSWVHSSRWEWNWQIPGVTGMAMVWGILSAEQQLCFITPVFVPGCKLRQESSSCGIRCRQCCKMSVLEICQHWEVKQAVLPPPHCSHICLTGFQWVFVVGERRKYQKNATLHWDSQPQFWNTCCTYF